MAACRYSRWALISADANPTEIGPTVFNPPMLPTLAVGNGTSLVFDLDVPPARLEVRLVATALAAEGREADCLRVFTGAEPDTYIELQSVQWGKTVEGLHATFTARATGVRRYVKLLFPTGPDLIVTGITFEAL